MQRIKELYCVFFGHTFGEHFYRKEACGFILEQHDTCTNCGLTKIDKSGMLLRYKQKHGWLDKPASYFNENLTP